MAGDFYLTAKLEELIMKKSDLRDLIKPLVKECIQEVLIEEGMEYEDAIEFLDYNVVGAYVGDKTPQYINFVTQEVYND